VTIGAIVYNFYMVATTGPAQGTAALTDKAALQKIEQSNGLEVITL
jgi:hypothetical protein